MAPINSSQTPQQHIPAWKRLGLKLKFAEETQDNLQPIASQLLPNPASTPDSNTKVKRQRDQSSHSTEEPPAKKSKSLKRNLTPEAREDSPGLKRKKSVTFTPETKREDGDSIKQLFGSWVAQQKKEDPTFGARQSSIPAFKTPEPPQVTEQVDDSTLNDSEKHAKRVKKWEKSKKTKISEVKKPVVPARLSPALSYLRQYHDAKDTWKFNKNHQNFIIKNVFDVTKIPLEHNDILHHYITGLQGTVRTRLRDSAIQIKVQDQEAGSSAFPSNMSDPDKKQQEYNAAMSEYVATVTMRDAPPAMGYEEGIALNLSDYAMKERIGKRMRAERILVQLARDSTATNGDADSQKRLRLNDGSAQKTARKRKLRTAVVDDDEDDDTSSSGTTDSSSDDSSTEEGSSGSGDESSSSEDGDDEGVRGGAEDEDTSSSSSSSSSGSEEEDSDDSDDDDEDESE